MPFATVDRTRMYYRLEGREDRPLLVLSHSLGLDHGQWDQQVPDLLARYQVLRYDIRGHGASDSTPGECTIEQLGRDVLALVDSLGAREFFFCGLSLGGMIGQWLAAHAPERVRRAVLANTSPYYADKSTMEARRAKVREEGMSGVADIVMQRFFTAASLALNPPHVAWARRTLLASDPAGYAACCSAILAMDQRELLPTIKVPALVISGDHDVSTPWTGAGQVLAQAIPGAAVVHLPAAHLSNMEQPRSFTAALFEFLDQPAEGDPYDAGMAVRRSVLGDAHVDRSIAGSTSFNWDFQAMITRFAWGTVWTRPAVNHLMRRMMVLTAMAALGRWEEFRMHVRAGLAHELEPCDLKELLLQAGVYAGVPAANTGFQIAAEELKAAGR